MENIVSHIKIGKEHLAYYVIGEGDRYLVCFHGFDEGKEVFENWLPSYGKKYTMICFDLPAHGDSSNFHATRLKSFELIEFVESIKAVFNIETFDLLAFSIGSRIGFSLLEVAFSSISQAYFYAPDGVKEHPIYRLSVRTFFGHLLFEYFVHHPELLIKVARKLYAYKFLSVSLLRYLEKRWMKTSLREKLYNTWYALSLLKYKTLNHVPTKIIFGEKDTLISPKLLNRFKASDKIETFVVPFSHQLITSKLNDWNCTLLDMDSL